MQSDDDMGKDKNKYGQYFTRAEIADFMVSLITKPVDATVLEPSCGEGVFLERLAARGFERVTGYEIDCELSKEYNNVKTKKLSHDDRVMQRNCREKNENRTSQC